MLNASWLTTSDSTLRPCCHLEKPMSPSEAKCAPELILLLLSDVMVHCAATKFEVLEWSISPTRSEMHMAADILRREVSSSPLDECLLQVPTSRTAKFVNYFFFLVNSICKAPYTTGFCLLGAESIHAKFPPVPHHESQALTTCVHSKAPLTNT